MSLNNGHTTHQPHGFGIRGLHDKTNIDSSQGKFGRLFDIAAAKYKDDDLFALAQAMTGSPDDVPKDDPDDEESHVPAAYTYFGQFVDHDITFDPETFAQQKTDPNGIVDFRSPRFDMDNVYGRGPGDQPYLYDGIEFLQGEPLGWIARNPSARDLPRAATNMAGARRAIIGDPRNDENVIVSQLEGMMYRFHNQVIATTSSNLAKAGPPNSDELFDQAQQSVRWHYQWVVVKDFLSRIVRKDVLDKISPAISDPKKSFKGNLPNLPNFQKRFKGDPRIPVEFSVAAYRLGHSMVRPGYRVNENIPPIPIFNPINPRGGLNAFGEFPSAFTVDWQRFIDLGMGTAKADKTFKDRIQFAYKIDTSVVFPLAVLPHSIAGDEANADPKLKSLIFRNLRRGNILGLPSGQDVATAIGAKPLADKDIKFGAAVGTKAQDNKTPDITKLAGGAFRGKCPLWAYILAEGRKNFFDNGEARLGDVGGTIVGETFLGLLKCDPNSFLSVNPGWTPTLGRQPGQFTLADILKLALQS